MLRISSLVECVSVLHGTGVYKVSIFFYLSVYVQPCLSKNPKYTFYAIKSSLMLAYYLESGVFSSLPLLHWYHIKLKFSSCFIKPVLSSYCYTKLQEHFNVNIVFRKHILIPHFHHHQANVNLIYSDDFIILEFLNMSNNY
jgi:hypothetical protein